ncbi:MAG TPA: hypothetical protein V6C88_18100 [Chroococcidiopsis sp.]
MSNTSASDYDFVYEGNGAIPRLDHNCAMLLPSQPNAQKLKLDRLIECRRYRHGLGNVYLKMKVQPSSVNGVIVRNQLSDAEKCPSYYLEEIIKGIYEYLIVGIRYGEGAVPIPCSGAEVILLDAEMSWDISLWWIRIVTHTVFKEALDPIEANAMKE